MQPVYAANAFRNSLALPLSLSCDGGGDSHVRVFGMDYVQVDDYTKLPQMLSFL